MAALCTMMLCSMKIRMAYSILGILLGIIAGAAFAIMFQNYVCAAVAVFSSLCALFLTYIHFAYHRSWMFEWSPVSCKLIVIINAILSVLALAGMTICLVLAGIRRQAPDGNSLWVVSVWCWMTFKWTMMAAVYTNRYARNISEQSITITSD
jgi:hypothetical protein